MHDTTQVPPIQGGRPAGLSKHKEEDWDNDELTLGPSEKLTMPKETMVELTETAQLSADPTHGPTAEVSPVGDA